MQTQVTDTVREKYGAAARRVLEGGAKATCCGPGGDCGTSDAITRDLYDAVTASEVPDAALLASLGCGNPTALAELAPGEVVLDLGSGGGIDVLLSARRVGPTGHAYGLDMTDDMLALARRNAAEADVRNVTFLKGHIEDIPLPDASVDVIISNCVINLSGDKERVLEEAFRVLRPGGRFAVSDVVVRGPVPAEVQRSLELWAGCVAGALDEATFVTLLEGVGFEQASVEPTRVYTAEEGEDLMQDAGLDPGVHGPLIEGRIMAAFVRATKPVDADAKVAHAAPAEPAHAGGAGPAAEPCCGPDCCP